MLINMWFNIKLIKIEIVSFHLNINNSVYTNFSQVFFRLAN